MFPTIEKYIEEMYIKKDKPVKITYSLEKEVKAKAEHILEIAKRGRKVVFPDIVKIKEKLQKEFD